jgi:hypothetical protein
MSFRLIIAVDFSIVKTNDSAKKLQPQRMQYPKEQQRN